uniref:Uncharacterized protein n=1 Tax=Magallana gigas TaxID=29159 RepID=K1R778_MAGGI
MNKINAVDLRFDKHALETDVGSPSQRRKVSNPATIAPLARSRNATNRSVDAMISRRCLYGDPKSHL